jgi:MFS family permease
LNSCTEHPYRLIFARLFAGFGIGILMTCIPMYQAEVSTPESRGLMVSMHGVMYAVGNALTSWIGFGVYFYSADPSRVDSSFPWRFPLAFQAVPSLLLLAGSFWLPYSPRWLMQKDRFEEAKNILIRLHAKKGDGEKHHDTAIKEFYQIKKQLEHDREAKKSSSLFVVLKSPSNRKRFAIAIVMMWFNMFTGAIIIVNYFVILLAGLGLTGYLPLLLLAVWVMVSFPGNIFCALYVDKFGRRKFMLVGATGLSVTLFFECLLQALYTGTGNVAGQRAAVFFIFLFIVFWSFCFDATEYLYLSEIFPTEIRGMGTAAGMFSFFAAQVVLLVAGPIALNNIGWKFFLGKSYGSAVWSESEANKHMSVLVIPTTIYIPIIYFFFPETRGRSFEDINAQFGDKVVLRYYGATEEEDEEYAKAIETEERVGSIAGHEVAAKSNPN